MKAARLYEYDAAMEVELKIEKVREPTIMKPDEVIVRVGAAGLCRTDLHIIEGVWKDIMDHDGHLLPFIMGHENAGWVEDVGSGVTSVKPGDAVICHPLRSCGICLNCRYGEDMHCEHSSVPRPRPRRRLRRVFPHQRARADQAQHRHHPARRGADGRRRHHRLPRRQEGREAAAPRRLLRDARRRRPRPHRAAVPAGDLRLPASSPSTASPARRRWPRSSAPTSSSTAGRTWSRRCKRDHRRRLRRW